MEFQIEPLHNPNLDQPSAGRPLLSGRNVRYAIYGAAVVLLIALIGFFLGRGSFSEGKVDLKIEGPTEISAGELVTYKLSYKNNNKASLDNVRLTFFYPQDAVVSKDGDLETGVVADSVDLGSLESGAGGEKEFTVFVVGDRGNIKAARATMTFEASGVRSTFKKDATLTTTIATLDVPITLVATPTLINGQKTSYIVDYRNQTQEDIRDLRLVVKYPSGFAPSNYSSNPTARVSGQDSWDIPLLKGDSGSRITITGNISGKERENKVVSLVLQRKITTPGGDKYVDFEKTESTSIISAPVLSLQMLLNGSTDYTARLGDALRYKVTFSNNTENDISGLNLSVNLSGNMYDLTTVSSDGFFDSRQNSIFWNASNVSALNILRPNQSGTAEFEVRLKNNFSGGGAQNSFVKASAHIETGNVPQGLDLDKLTAGAELVTRISASPSFTQKMLLNDSSFGSSGPFPPKVDRKTIFTVRWNLTNPANDLASAKVVATLAPGVTWENQTRVNGSQPQPVYNQQQNTVTWNMGTLPGGIGVSFPQYESNFLISITPSVNQVGQPVTLLKDIRFEGTDSFTQEKISRTIPDTNTFNLSDASGNGSVQP